MTFFHFFFQTFFCLFFTILYYDLFPWNYSIIQCPFSWLLTIFFHDFFWHFTPWLDLRELVLESPWKGTPALLCFTAVLKTHNSIRTTWWFFGLYYTNFNSEGQQVMMSPWLNIHDEVSGDAQLVILTGTCTRDWAPVIRLLHRLLYRSACKRSLDIRTHEEQELVQRAQLWIWRTRHGDVLSRGRNSARSEQLEPLTWSGCSSEVIEI